NNDTDKFEVNKINSFSLSHDKKKTIKQKKNMFYVEPNKLMEDNSFVEFCKNITFITYLDKDKKKKKKKKKKYIYKDNHYDDVKNHVDTLKYDNMYNVYMNLRNEKNINFYNEFDDNCLSVKICFLVNYIKNNINCGDHFIKDVLLACEKEKDEMKILTNKLKKMKIFRKEELCLLKQYDKKKFTPIDMVKEYLKKYKTKNLFSDKYFNNISDNKDNVIKMCDMFNMISNYYFKKFYFNKYDYIYITYFKNIFLYNKKGFFDCTQERNLLFLISNIYKNKIIVILFLYHSSILVLEHYLIILYT
ncbi:hypothetical protein PFDG_03119, partial [Plasmodium falciparum Dd2]